MLSLRELEDSLSIDTVSTEGSFSFGFGRLFGLSFSAFLVFFDKELTFVKRFFATVFTLCKADGFSDIET